MLLIHFVNFVVFHLVFLLLSARVSEFEYEGERLVAIAYSLARCPGTN
jgi:hypothetical protein